MEPYSTEQKVNCFQRLTYLASNKFLTVFKESSYNFHSKSDNIVPVDSKIMYTNFEMPPELVPFGVSGYSSYARCHFMKPQPWGWDWQGGGYSIEELGYSERGRNGKFPFFPKWIVGRGDRVLWGWKWLNASPSRIPREVRGAVERNAKGVDTLFFSNSWPGLWDQTALQPARH